MASLKVPTLQTERLLLRAFEPDDLDPFASLNSDPRVMEHFPQTLTRIESEQMVSRIECHFRRHGFGLWAAEIVKGARAGEFIGFVGLAVPAFEASFTPCVEVGWRLACRHWGRGYATEGARAALELGFERVGLEEIVSFTVPANRRSWRVMERLGMHRRDADDFDHPNLDPGHPLRRHLLHRLGRREWQAAQAGSTPHL